MLTILLEARDGDARALSATFGCLISAAVEGLVREVVILDTGLGAAERELAQHAGCEIRSAAELEDVVAGARGEWLLLLEAGCEPTAGWTDAVLRHVARANADEAARFRPEHWRLFDAFAPSRSHCLARGLLAPRTLLNRHFRIGMRLRELAGAVPSRPLSARVRLAARR